MGHKERAEEVARLSPEENERLMKRHAINHGVFDDNRELMTEIYEHKASFGLPGEQFGDELSTSVGPYGLYVTIQYLKELGEDVKDFYRFNRYGFRSEEFIEDHDGKHVVFAGCSNTSGEAMWEEYIWPRVLYNKISKDTKLSGYFNLGKSGATVKDCYDILYNYIHRYGAPDVAFINLPAASRDKFKGIPKIISLIKKHPDTKFIILTWDVTFAKEHSVPTDTRFAIPGIIQFSQTQMVYDMFDYEDSFPEGPRKKFLLKALDDSHPGIAEQNCYAEMMYNSYYEYEKNKA